MLIDFPLAFEVGGILAYGLQNLCYGDAPGGSDIADPDARAGLEQRLMIQ